MTRAASKADKKASCKNCLEYSIALSKSFSPIVLPIIIPVAPAIPKVNIITNCLTTIVIELAATKEPSIRPIIVELAATDKLHNNSFKITGTEYL